MGVNVPMYCPLLQCNATYADYQTPEHTPKYVIVFIIRNYVIIQKCINSLNFSTKLFIFFFKNMFIVFIKVAAIYAPIWPKSNLPQYNTN